MEGFSANPYEPLRSCIYEEYPNQRQVLSRSTGGSGKIPISMTNEQIADLERRYLLPTYNRYPVTFERGKGVFLYDLEGKKYLDFVSGIGVNALGYAHPRIVKTIRDQAAKLIHISNLYYHEYQGLLAEKLAQFSGLAARLFLE